MLSVILLSVIILSVIIMSVIIKFIMIFVMLSVNMSKAYAIHRLLEGLWHKSHNLILHFTRFEIAVAKTAKVSTF
jgi:hypothetical protein